MNAPSAQKPARLPIVRRKMAGRVERIVVLVLLLISFLHLLRLLTGAEIIIAGTTIPVWTSLIGWFGPALLAALFWWSHR